MYRLLILLFIPVSMQVQPRLKEFSIGMVDTLMAQANQTSGLADCGYCLLLIRQNFAVNSQMPFEKAGTDLGLKVRVPQRIAILGIEPVIKIVVNNGKKWDGFDSGVVAGGILFLIAECEKEHGYAVRGIFYEIGDKLRIPLEPLLLKKMQPRGNAGFERIIHRIANTACRQHPTDSLFAINVCYKRIVNNDVISYQKTSKVQHRSIQVISFSILPISHFLAFICQLQREKEDIVLIGRTAANWEGIRHMETGFNDD